MTYDRNPPGRLDNSGFFLLYNWIFMWSKNELTKLGYRHQLIYAAWQELWKKWNTGPTINDKLLDMRILQKWATGTWSIQRKPMPISEVLQALHRNSTVVWWQQFDTIQRCRRKGWERIPDQKMAPWTHRGAWFGYRILAKAMGFQCPQTRWCNYCKSNRTKFCQ